MIVPNIMYYLSLLINKIKYLTSIYQLELNVDNAQSMMQL
jgi:hypothetical protein